MSSGCTFGSMMLPRDFEEFAAEQRRQGFDEVLQRQWPAFAELPVHTHDFTAKALLVQGEMWLTVGEETRHLVAGSTFELSPRAPHAERYGSAGTTYWVARRGELSSK